MRDELKSFKVGDRIKIVALPAYVKTAEPMPMLRSPDVLTCLLYTSPSPRDKRQSRMPSSA